MSEWQPARVRGAHDRGNSTEFMPLKNRELSKTMVIRVQPREFKEHEVTSYRSIGCDATRFFTIHPEDAAKLWVTDPFRMTQICEHEILTD